MEGKKTQSIRRVYRDASFFEKLLKDTTFRLIT